MSITENDLLAMGSTLAAANSECEWRASISRSYYAAYHKASDWHEKLASQGIAQPGRGVHATLIECLKNPTVTGQKMMRSKSLGYVLGHMKASRHKADYQLAAQVDQAEADTVAADAATLLQKAV